jgi:serine/threonine-protein kinase
LEAVGCPRCRRPVPADAPFGECPACLLLLGLADTPDGDREGTVAATVAAEAVTASGPGPTDPDATLSHIAGSPTYRTDWPKIPGHVLVRELGAGGGGTVYLAEQIGAGRRLVAVKVLHGTSRVERERMVREAKSLGRLTHPNVVRLFEVGESAGGPYFTMEYVAGGSLADRIRTGKPAAAESARIVQAVAQAIQAAHDLGLRHRDLKPSNILLESDGTPKVADFGLVKESESAGTGTTAEQLTHTGQLLGTPTYMAPEQAGRRNAVVDDRTDVYGLGAVLYQSLTGNPPFTADTREEIIRQVLADDPVWPRANDRTVPRELEAVCLKCLEKDPARRYATAEEVAEELSRWRRGEATHVRPPSWIARVARKARYYARPIAAAAAMVLMCASVTVAVLRTGRGETRSEAVEDPLARARDDLARRLSGTDPVVLIPEAGPPAWFEWTTGATIFTESHQHDGGCTIHSVVESRLELVPAVLAPRSYRLEADVRHEANSDPLSEVGVYFGERVWESSAESRLIGWYELAFNDFRGRPGNPKVPRSPKVISLKVVAVRERPNSRDKPAQIPIGEVRIDPPEDFRARVWRRLRIEVRPTGLTAENRIANGPVPLIGTPVERSALDDFGRDTAKQPAAAPRADPPPWGTPGAVGVFVRKGQGAFRSVVLTPLPDP